MLISERKESHVNVYSFRWDTNETNATVFHSVWEVLRVALPVSVSWRASWVHLNSPNCLHKCTSSLLIASMFPSLLLFPCVLLKNSTKYDCDIVSVFQRKREEKRKIMKHIFHTFSSEASHEVTSMWWHQPFKRTVRVIAIIFKKSPSLPPWLCSDTNTCIYCIYLRSRHHQIMRYYCSLWMWTFVRKLLVHI